MAKVQHISGISKRIPFEGFDFYDLFRVTFENSELGRMKRLLPLHEMAVNFGLVSNRYERKRGPKPFFSAEGKVALMFLKMYTGQCSKADGAVERQHPLSDILRHLDQSIASIDELQN